MRTHLTRRAELARQFQPNPTYFPLRTPYFVRMDHDAAHKYIYSLPKVTADLLRLVVPSWMDALDLDTLEERSSEFLDAEHRRRQSDLAWQVGFRGKEPSGGERPRLIVLAEFQSEVDRHMARRMREYTEMLLERAIRSAAPQRGTGLPWVLPIVVYNGSESWTAGGRATDLAPLPSERAARDLALFQPQAYHLLTAGGGLTSGAAAAKDWPLENRVSATAWLQRSGTSRALLPCLLAEARRFPGVANEPFRRVLHSWARALWEHRTGDDLGFPGFDELERTKGAVMATVAEAAWDRWDAKVRAEGGAHLLSRQAALRFGAGTAERLDGLLEGLTAQDDLDRVGAWVLQCGSGSELLSRVSGLLENRQG